MHSKTQNIAMTVTEKAKILAATHPALAWNGVYPDQIYDYDAKRLPPGESMAAGDRFHRNMERYWDDQWVNPSDEYVCSVVTDILLDLGIEQIESECPVSNGKLSGRVDLLGIHKNGRHWVIEIKTTQGAEVLPPRPQELCQLALYASLLKLNNPALACLRINLRTQKIAVFHMYDCQEVLGLVAQPRTAA
jgi:hypothetical protein